MLKDWLLPANIPRQSGLAAYRAIYGKRKNKKTNATGGCLSYNTESTKQTNMYGNTPDVTTKYLLSTTYTTKSARHFLWL